MHGRGEHEHAARRQEQDEGCGIPRTEKTTSRDIRSRHNGRHGNHSRQLGPHQAREKLKDEAKRPKPKCKLEEQGSTHIRGRIANLSLTYRKQSETGKRGRAFGRKAKAAWAKEEAEAERPRTYQQRELGTESTDKTDHRKRKEVEAERDADCRHRAHSPK